MTSATTKAPRSVSKQRAAGVTHVSVGYLEGLRASLSQILRQVNAQLVGHASAEPGTTAWVSPVDSNLTVLAGDPSFNLGAALNAGLSKMGGSVHAQLAWLSTMLTAAIGQVDTTIKSFTATERANQELVGGLVRTKVPRAGEQRAATAL